jgi:hypothetical protein
MEVAETKKHEMVERKDAPPHAPARHELDGLLAEQADAGRRLQKVAVEDGALILQGTEEAQRRVGASFGTDDREFQTYCIAQLMAILPEAAHGDDFTLPINSAVEMLSAIAPRDAMEAMLAVQMVATNHLALLSTRRAVHSPTIEARQMNGNLATKFSRTFTAQIEALNRHRRGGKQIVEHVHVNAGGQAVIAGSVTTGGGVER